jgi:hypothetical protein
LNKENVIVISNSQRLGTKEETFRQELAKLPGVSGVSITSSNPTAIRFEDGYVPEPAGAKEQVAKEIGLPSFLVDDGFCSRIKN